MGASRSRAVVGGSLLLEPGGRGVGSDEGRKRARRNGRASVTTRPAGRCFRRVGRGFAKSHHSAPTSQARWDFEDSSHPTRTAPAEILHRAGHPHTFLNGVVTSKVPSGSGTFW